MTDFKDELLSCDTLGVAAARSAYGCNLFAKNSDRPTGECQPLIWIPAADHEEGEPLDCSGFTIPQAAHTYGVLGSHPYWIYGFEMGINEHGVFIGNEAEFSRDLGKEPEDGLLGMDLLRLGLERGATAREAMEVIIDLTEKYGQNHNANPYGDGRYENSYLITDANEEWVLETAGRRHVARRIDGTFAVGNCYSIEDDFETASPDIEEYARENGWLLPYEKFQFAKAYTKPGPGLTISNPRR